MAWVAAAGAAAGGLMGAEAQRKAANKAAKIQDAAAKEIYGLDVPDVSELQYTPDEIAYAGDLQADRLNQVQDIESEYNGITSDPRFAQAQYQSLGGLDDIINNGGMTQADKLAYQQATDDAAMQASREGGNITRDMAERGMGGSGMELAQRLASSQGAANRGAAAAQTQAATAQQRALDALLQRGNLAGSMQTADFDRQSKAAAAKDAIQQFNRANSMSINQSNQNANNRALEANQSQRQTLNNNNTQIRNTGKQNNTDAVQTTYQNQMDKAIAGSNAATGQANTRIQAGNQQANMYAGVGAAGGQLAGAAYNQYNAPDVKKEEDK